MSSQELLPSPRLRWKWVAQILTVFVLVGLPLAILGGVIGRGEGGSAGMRLGVLIPTAANISWAILLLALVAP